MPAPPEKILWACLFEAALYHTPRRSVDAQQTMCLLPGGRWLGDEGER
jgi:hypothetical protein